MSKSPIRPLTRPSVSGRKTARRSEKLLKCLEAPGEYISYSEWEDDAAIEKYRASDDHKTIQRHLRRLQGAQAEVKRYEVTG